MRAMKIPNLAVMALIAGFAVLGLIAFPFEQYLWQWSHFAVVLVIGFVLNIVGYLGQAMRNSQPQPHLTSCWPTYSYWRGSSRFASRPDL